MQPIVPQDFTPKSFNADAQTYERVEAFAEAETRGVRVVVGDEGTVKEDGGWRFKITSFIGLVQHVRKLTMSVMRNAAMILGLRNMWPWFFRTYWQPAMQAIEREVGFDRLSTPRPNGVPNGGFQYWTGGAPGGWTLSGAGASVAQQTRRTGAFTDEFAAEITSGPAASATLSRSDLAFQPGSVHTVSGFVKINTSAQVQIKVTTNSGTDVPQILPLTGGSGGVGALGWFHFPRPMGFQLTFTPNADATTMTLSLIVVNFNQIAQFSSISMGPGPMRDADLYNPAPEDLAGVTGDFNIPGKLTVGGLIDPTGLQFDGAAANPGDALTLWADSGNSNRLNYDSQVVALGTTSGAKIETLRWTELLTIAAGATTDTATDLPAGAIILGVSVRVTTVIPTAATFTVTGGTSATAFNTGASVSTAANTTNAGTAAGAYYNAAAQKVRITPDLVPAANTGRVRLVVFYMLVTPPTA